MIDVSKFTILWSMNRNVANKIMSDPDFKVWWDFIEFLYFLEMISEEDFDQLGDFTVAAMYIDFQCRLMGVEVPYAKYK